MKSKFVETINRMRDELRNQGFSEEDIQKNLVRNFGPIVVDLADLKTFDELQDYLIDIAGLLNNEKKIRKPKEHNNSSAIVDSIMNNINSPKKEKKNGTKRQSKN